MPGLCICQGSLRRYGINGKRKGAEVDQQRFVELGAEEFFEAEVRKQVDVFIGQGSHLIRSR